MEAPVDEEEESSDSSLSDEEGVADEWDDFTGKERKEKKKKKERKNETRKGSDAINTGRTDSDGMWAKASGQIYAR